VNDIEELLDAVAAPAPRPRSGNLTYLSVGNRGEPYPEWLRALKGASGVYVIRGRDTAEILYRGESHTGRPLTKRSRSRRAP